MCETATDEAFIMRQTLTILFAYILSTGVKAALEVVPFFT